MSSKIVVIASKENNSFMCVVDGKASKIRNNNNSPIKHQIFDFYAAYANKKLEKYWFDLFTNASRGNFPRGYKFLDNRHLSIKVGNSLKKYDVTCADTNNVDMYYENLKNFMETTSAGSCRTDDSYNPIPLPNQENDTHWSGSIPPNIQIFMIKVFCNRMKEQYNLSTLKTKELVEALTTKIFTGEITGTEIQRCNYNIVAVQGLLFDGKGNFILNSREVKAIVKRQSKSTFT